VADRFDVVAVGIEYEGAVVVGVILRAQPRPAVVLAAGGDGGAIEGVDGGAVLGGDGDVNAAIEAALVADPEIGLSVGAEAGSDVSAAGLWDLHDERVAERRQRSLVESFRSFVVGYRNSDVVQHCDLPSSASRPFVVT